jgi:hypothetical protein
MKIKIRSTHRPCLVVPPGKTKTLIVGGTITHVNGEEWNHPYCAIVPGDRITLEDIEWEAATTMPEMYELGNEWKIKGSKGDVYTVREVSPHIYTCDCPHYTYRKQICKHIREVA